MFNHGSENFIDGEDFVHVPHYFDDNSHRKGRRKEKRSCNPNNSRTWSSNASCSTLIIEQPFAGFNMSHSTAKR
jgi:hypothetical protein